jgi:hypothetical protein
MIESNRFTGGRYTVLPYSPSRGFGSSEAVLFPKDASKFKYGECRLRSRGNLVNCNPKNRLLAAIVAACFFGIFINDERVLASDIDASPGPEDKMLAYSVISLDIIGFVFACGNLSYVINKERSTLGWQIGGWTFAGLNAAGGIYFLVRVIEEGKDADLSPWLGAINIVVAGLDVGFTIWSSIQPERPEQNITLAPMVMPDFRGNPAFGVGLRLVDW